MTTLDFQGKDVFAALESQFKPKPLPEIKPEIRIKNAIVCSFFTSDDYYKAHGARLKANLESLGIQYDLREITKKEGEDWAAICRRKVGFIAEVCEKNPDKKVFWIDVDCELFSIPDFILNSSADLIGFQRGFSSPTKIGYQNRGRFWEPCFWGINNSNQARAMIKAAADFEEVATVRATDDYFFEEAWRATSGNMTFQIIPSNCAVDKGAGSLESHEVFFRFGSSGQVENFKNLVEQHKGNTARRLLHPKRELLRIVRKIEEKLPLRISTKLRLIVDASGITGFLTGKNHNNINNQTINKLVAAGKSGNLAEFNVSLSHFRRKVLPNRYESAAIKVASSYLAYSAKPGNKEISLSWWENPFPGNFGDWLTPFIFNHYTENKIIFQGLTNRTNKSHIVSLGSVGRFIKSNSVVVGTGVSSFKHALNPKADYISVRGPHTAKLLRDSGGPEITCFGDPGVVLARILPFTRGETNGRIALVRHYTHLQAPVRLPENFDELSVQISHPNDIIAFIEKLNEYESVVTSAMHVMITCQSYGIPCALVVFKGFEEYVHGTGIKYSDYALGAGVPVMDPIAIDPNLDIEEIKPITFLHKVSEAKIDEVEAAIRVSLNRFKK
ncbi:MAG: polysaccharide pyruvyl transferase family protein [Candidatus Nanopelagicaceae bacterium]